MDKKIIAAGILVMLFLGCTGTQEQAVLGEYEIEEIKYGEVIEQDLDSDGSIDRYTYILPKEEIEEDVYLQKSMTYDIQGDMMNGSLTLYFENTASEDKEIRHVEEIPKSFASHVSQLRFNIPPTEVLEEDPVLSWEKRILNRNNIGIVIQAGAQKIASSTIQTISSWLGTEHKAEKDETAAAAVGEKFADLGFDGLMLKADTMAGGTQKNNLRIKIMEKYPQKFIADDCQDLGGVFQQVCLAITTEDYLKCERIQGQEDQEACKRMLYNSVKNKRCAQIQNQITKDLCVHKAAVTADYAPGCQDIKDPEKLYGKEICQAEVTQEIEWCQKIPGKFKEGCCEKIRDSQRRLECIGELLEITPEELKGTKGTKYKFTVKSYAPPQNPLYRWSFGQDRVETNETEIEYTFAVADTYQISVELVDKDTGQAIDKGYATAVITEPAYVPTTAYEKLLATNKLSASLSAYGKEYEIKEGKRRDYNDSNSASCYTYSSNLTWNGRLFSCTHTWETTQPDGRIVHHKITIDGAIAENETRLEWLSCQRERLDNERPELYTDHYVTKFQIKDLELESSGLHSHPEFTASMSGPEVRFHVNYGPEIHQESTVGDKEYVYHSFTEIYWNSDYKKPGLSLRFSTK